MHSRFMAVNVICATSARTNFLGVHSNVLPKLFGEEWKMCRWSGELNVLQNLCLLCGDMDSQTKESYGNNDRLKQGRADLTSVHA